VNLREREEKNETGNAVLPVSSFFLKILEEHVAQKKAFIFSSNLHDFQRFIK
jgi:hypothetical protein